MLKWCLLSGFEACEGGAIADRLTDSLHTVAVRPEFAAGTDLLLAALSYTECRYTDTSMYRHIVNTVLGKRFCSVLYVCH